MNSKTKGMISKALADVAALKEQVDDRFKNPCTRVNNFLVDALDYVGPSGLKWEELDTLLTCMAAYLEGGREAGRTPVHTKVWEDLEIIVEPLRVHVDFVTAYGAQHDQAFSPDGGTILDGGAGWHNTYRAVELAVGLGFALEPGDREAIDAYKESHGEEDLDDLCDRATEYLQEFAPAGCVFDWDCGELALVNTAYAEIRNG